MALASRHGSSLASEKFPVLAALVAAGLLAVAIAGPALADDEVEEEGPRIEWQLGPCVCQLGSAAQIRIPEGFRCTGREGTKRFLELNQNPASGEDLGTVLSPIGDDDRYWFAIFTFDEIGFVKDDEKDKLDASKILSSIKEGTEAANEERRKRGWGTLEIVGWERQPFYDSKTNNLSWAIRAKSAGGESVNYSTRLLGRYGVMHANLVTSVEQFGAQLPEFEESLQAFSFQQGNRYAEFRAGDKIAKYGLTALVAGGAGAALAKSGLLAKFWKLLVLGAVAMFAVIKRFFARLFGKQENPVNEGPQDPR
jgi:uncharacterized membrane-anchored protein